MRTGRMVRTGTLALVAPVVGCGASDPAEESSADGAEGEPGRVGA